MNWDLLVIPFLTMPVLTILALWLSEEIDKNFDE